MKKSNKINIVRALMFSAFTLLTGMVLAQDPATPGPFGVLSTEYNLGATAFTPENFPDAVEVQASVHYPSDLSQGNFPLIVFMHGRHVPCYSSSGLFVEWPCASGHSSVPSYQGYDYLAEVLASHGYIVVSVSANGITVSDNNVIDVGMNARALLLQHHLDLWNDFNTSAAGTFGSLFVGKVNMNNIGTMGHSRGGEGVAWNFLHNEAIADPYGINAVLLLAPTNFNRVVLNDVALAVTLPYCDGDVSDLQGVHFYDDARYSSATDTSAKHTFLVMGANHNFFNTVWTPGLFGPGARDDWGSPSDSHCGTSSSERLTSAEQRGANLAFIAGFFRRYLGNEPEFLDLLTGDSPPPASAMGSSVHVSYHPAASERLDVNRLDSENSEITNTLGGSASQSGLSEYDICGDDSGEIHCLAGQSQSRQPHTTASARSPMLGLSQLQIEWSSGGDWYDNQLPVGQRDISVYDYLQFRAGVNFVDSPSGLAQDFHVQLMDGSGGVASVRVGSVSDALFYPPGNLGSVPKLFLNTVRIPLSSFSGVDMSNITSIRFNFGETNQGSINISDLVLTDETGEATFELAWLIPVLFLLL